MERRFYTPREIAQALGVSRSEGYRLCNEGVIPSVKIGGNLRVPVRALERALKEFEEQAEERARTLRGMKK